MDQGVRSVQTPPEGLGKYLCNETSMCDCYSCIWASTPENLSWWFANNTGTDQPVHLRSLISAFVICLLESFISYPARSEFSIF